jgi:hypothetical protein
MQAWRAHLHGLLGAHHHGQQVVVDTDQVHCVPGVISGIGDHDGDGITHVADRVACQRRVRHHFEIGVRRQPSRGDQVVNLWSLYRGPDLLNFCSTSSILDSGLRAVGIGLDRDLVTGNDGNDSRRRSSRICVDRLDSSMSIVAANKRGKCQPTSIDVIGVSAPAGNHPGSSRRFIGAPRIALGIIAPDLSPPPTMLGCRAHQDAAAWPRPIRTSAIRAASTMFW